MGLGLLKSRSGGRKRQLPDPRELGCRCDECPLNGKAVPVFPTLAKHDKPKLIIVGEGPGRKEEAQGRPFVGASGALLNQVLAEAGIDRSVCHVSNAALCAGDLDKDNEQAARACAPRLLQEAVRYPGVPILTLGAAAAKTILGVSSVQLARGFVWTAPEVTDSKLKAAKKNEARTVELGLKRELAGRKVFPTVHPAFVLRSDAWRPVFQIDVNRVGRWLRGELDDSRMDNNIEGAWRTVDDPVDLWRALDVMGPIVSCDIETTITGSVLTADIVCVGISDGTTTIIIDPWVPAAHAGVVSAAFRSRTVVGHNFLNFDKLALERDGVVFDGPVEDTLLAHHAFASHFPQKLDQVVSTFCDATPWKIVFGRRGGTVASEKGGLPPHKMPAAERDFYCAQDCILTWKSWMRMQKDLDPERVVYEHDKKLSALASGMQVGGIGVDHEKREALLVALEERGGNLLLKMREGLGWPEFDPARVAHVKDALYNRLKARVIERTPTGQPSTSEAVLETLAKYDDTMGEFARDLMTYRLVAKVNSTYCNPPEAPIWMADGSFKPIGDVQIGDEVMGWDDGSTLPAPNGGVFKGSKKRKFTASKVLAVGRRNAPIVRVQLLSGDEIRCTPDHRWLRGGPYNKKHPWLTRLSADCGRSLARIVRVAPPCPDKESALWLGGIFDGEGHISKRYLDIAQSPTHNPDVCAKIESSLSSLGIPIKATRGGNATHYRIQTRQDIVNFLEWTNPVKRKRAAKTLYSAVSWKADTIVGVTPDGDGEVVSLTTETGNYVAWGFGSKNCEPIPILADGRAHYNWKGFGTVSGRMASRFQSVPRPGLLPEQQVRALYCATGRLPTARLVAQVHDAAIFEVGDELVYFDLSQAEARLAAYLSGDPELIAAVETDIHTANAKLLFGTKPGAEDGRFDKPKLKGLLWEEGGFRKERDVTKNAGFCVWYVGAADKVFSTLTSKGFPVTMRHCEIFYNRCHDKYWRYYEYVNRNLEMVRKQGYMRTAQLGRFRWLGYFSPITDVANYPIQAGIADVMNERLMQIEAQAKMMTSADDVIGLVKETWSKPVRLLKGPIVSEDREFVLPAEIKRGKRWSEL